MPSKLTVMCETCILDFLVCIILSHFFIQLLSDLVLLFYQPAADSLHQWGHFFHVHWGILVYFVLESNGVTWGNPVTFNIVEPPSIWVQ